jgi:cell division inhibitor SepF
MSALRKAGVWLGLVEDEDDRGEDGLFDDEFGEDDDFAVPVRPRSITRPSQRSPERERRDGLADRDADLRNDRDSRSDLRSERELRAERDLRTERELRAAERERELRSERVVRTTELPEPRAEARAAEPRLGESRASVRPLARPSSGSTALSFPTQDNLALAPQVQLRERAVVSEDKGRRPQITTLHPTSYSEARSIGEHFRDGNPVIMNLTEMDEPDAKRLVDFAAGLAFGLRGSMERVTNRVFLLSPPNIRVSEEDKARIAEGGFFEHS